MNFETLAYGGWQNCYRISNEKYEIIVTGDVGPRIIHFSLLGGPNVLHQFDSDMGQSGGDEYRFYGGHRLWHAPERIPRTYQPDNGAVDHWEEDNVHFFFGAEEEATGIQKQLSLQFKDESVIIDHVMANHGLWSVELAPWAVTMMKAGGLAIMPLPPHVSHQNELLPTHSISLWGYTSLNDERLLFGDKYILVAQDKAKEKPIKIGLHVVPDFMWSVGWLEYVNDGLMFVKSFQPWEGEQRYTDLGSQVEVFTNDKFLELETLGPLVRIRQEESIRHREYWSLHPDVAIPQSDMEIGQNILPLVREAHPTVGRRKTGALRPLG